MRFTLGTILLAICGCDIEPKLDGGAGPDSSIPYDAGNPCTGNPNDPLDCVQPPDACPSKLNIDTVAGTSNTELQRGTGGVLAASMIVGPGLVPGANPPRTFLGRAIRESLTAGDSSDSWFEDIEPGLPRCSFVDRNPDIARACSDDAGSVFIVGTPTDPLIARENAFWDVHQWTSPRSILHLVDVQKCKLACLQRYHCAEGDRMQRRGAALDGKFHIFEILRRNGQRTDVTIYKIGVDGSVYSNEEQP